jgi:hypothetical protein
MVQETPFQKNPSQKKDWWSAQDVGPEFKSHYHKKEAYK